MVRRVPCGQGKRSYYLTMLVVEAPAMTSIATDRKSTSAETEEPHVCTSAARHPQSISTVAVLL